MGFDTALATAWVTRAAEVVKDNADHLTALDSAIGDGDHGANLARGLAASVAAVAEKSPETPGKVLVAAGSALVSKTGGASGPLYGTLLRRAGKSLGDTADADAAALAAALGDGLAGVVELGSAQAGDKTMVDALIPATEALTGAAGAEASLAEAAKLAADAAEAGAEATTPLQARKGRASYLGERSIGHRDPGAASTALLLKALADVTAEGT
jgi:phosphoenolpyruvate---glycerone phosphotransferase subunit DhaL